MSVPNDHGDENYRSPVRPQAAMGNWLRDVSRDKSRLQRLAMIWGITLVVVVAAVLWLSGGRYTGTDDAYVRAAKLMVTTDVSGLVKSVNVKAGQHVKKGDVLFVLDPQEFQNAVDNAQAALDQTKLDLSALKTSYRSLVGEVQAQEATVRLDEINYKRYAVLAKTNAVSAEQLDTARGTLQSARGTLTSLKESAASTLAKLNGNPDLPLEKYPAYLDAKATLAEDKRQLDHTVVRAPFDSVVTEVDALQPGMLIVSSLSSFSTTSAIGMVSEKDVWVSANMKETDLTYVREGQDVEVSVDTYPGRTWHGKVQAISRGSDSTFSILPQENSSANWVKVTQRIPVRISLDLKPTDPPLRAGMSTVVRIDTGHRRWWRMLYGD